MTDGLTRVVNPIMSQPSTPSKAAPKPVVKPANKPADKPADKPAAHPTWVKPCAVFSRNFEKVVACAPQVGHGYKIAANLVRFKGVDRSSWLGVTLEFPFDVTQSGSEKSGFGFRYARKSIPLDLALGSGSFYPS